jgi:pimeloyl-ACP methyl ester carboxylesterase
MHVDTFGPADAPPLVFIHGGGVAGWMWRAQVRAFEGEYRVVVPDLPGHGRSSAGTYGTQAEVAALVASELEERGIRDATVVGFSLGAQLAAQLAATRPDLVARVVVVSGLSEPIPFAGASTKLLGLAAPLMRSRRFARTQAKSLFITDDLLEEYIEGSFAMSKENLVALTSANFAFRMPAAWPHYPGRALLIAGTREPATLLRSMRNLHAALPGSELELVDGAGHGVSLQRPEWFEQRLRPFLVQTPQ